jgi:hypothetical protein
MPVRNTRINGPLWMSSSAPVLFNGPECFSDKTMSFPFDATNATIHGLPDALLQ